MGTSPLDHPTHMSLQRTPSDQSGMLVLITQQYAERGNPLRLSFPTSGGLRSWPQYS
jgi:hypothetical protein